MSEVKNNKMKKKKILTLSGVFVFSFEKYIRIINLFPAGFAACFRVLVVDLEHVFIGRIYSLITQYFLQLCEIVQSITNV